MTSDKKWPTMKFNENVRDIILESYKMVKNIKSPSQKLEKVLKIGSIPPMFTTLRLNTLGTHLEKNAIEDLKFSLNQREKDRSGALFGVSIHPQMTDCVIIKNQGPFVVYPKSNEVIVDHSCGMSVLRGADVFSTGILSMTPHVKKGDLVSVYVDLQHKCRRGSSPKDFTGEKLFIGNGVAMVTRSDVFCSGNVELKGVGILMREPIYRSPQLSDLFLTFVHAQNLPSIVCVHVLNPQSDELVLDMCAAPGGKTSHIASLMKNKGCVIAIDKNKKKTDSIRNHLLHWNITNVQVYSGDSRHILNDDNNDNNNNNDDDDDNNNNNRVGMELVDNSNDDGDDDSYDVGGTDNTVNNVNTSNNLNNNTRNNIDNNLNNITNDSVTNKAANITNNNAISNANNNIKAKDNKSKNVVNRNKKNDKNDGPKFKSESFDRILLDAPCSALGQRPTVINDITANQLQSYPKLQKQLFETAVSLLKKGGVLVYSTCTTDVYENECIVSWALQRFTDLRLVQQVPHLGGSGWMVDGLSGDQVGLLQRFDPSILLDDTDDATTTGDDDDAETKHHHHHSHHRRHLPPSPPHQEQSDHCDCCKGRESYNIDTIGFFIAKFMKV